MQIAHMVMQGTAGTAAGIWVLDGYLLFMKKE